MPSVRIYNLNGHLNERKAIKWERASKPLTGFVHISSYIYSKEVSEKSKKRAERPRKETSERSLRVDLWRQTVKLQPWHFNWAQLYLEMNWLIATESFNSLLSLFISAKSLLAAEALIETCLPFLPRLGLAVAPHSHHDGGKEIKGAVQVTQRQVDAAPSIF